ncbi:V-type ATP synthase subunit F [Anaerocolumna cellulosilytica]|uniref:V-type ATP synthase subunit F n=1 Tax=Anaerocolumna cellulosilytica TaxID=433286 RepID=A0A6S6R630_9FIRM|nr:V-type ATP synthase subunit F [Anaerocolumna cellulosilytica]MBB5194011.1 V/A-type H+-transporting ATPase subunit F [Anaerocolumna cellulosilytica]BCJ94775.1 V-type ATP synthase subunit F [Anaerocolumna cellulosilytica]
MYKIAVLGDRDSIYGFAALGLDIYPIREDEDAAKKLKSLADGRYAVIYITEALQARLDTELDRYRSLKLPAIIPIPGVSGNTGMGMQSVKKSVEQAVGSDIIFNGN